MEITPGRHHGGEWDGDRGVQGPLSTSYALGRKLQFHEPLPILLTGVHLCVPILGLSLGVCNCVCKNACTCISCVPRAQVHKDYYVSCFSIPQTSKFLPLPCIGPTRDYQTTHHRIYKLASLLEKLVSNPPPTPIPVYPIETHPFINTGVVVKLKGLLGGRRCIQHSPWLC